MNIANWENRKLDAYLPAEERAEKFIAQNPTIRMQEEVLRAYGISEMYLQITLDVGSPCKECGCEKHINVAQLSKKLTAIVYEGYFNKYCVPLYAGENRNKVRNAA